MSTCLQKSYDFIANIINNYNFEYATKPIIIGINGPQGSGKTYLTSKLTTQLQEFYDDLKIISFSIDDFYLPYNDQLKLTKQAKLDDNKLLQGRGLPGTHDLKLLNEVFKKLIDNYKSNWEPMTIPFYDKSLNNGLGDRSDNESIILKEPVDVILFEGWFNGYRPLDNDSLRLKYLTNSPDSIIQENKMYHIEDINNRLRDYVQIWKYCEFNIFINTDSISNVYKWRMEQEHALIKLKGTGMTDDQIIKFVDRYMPMYILYYDKLISQGLSSPKNNLILDIDVNRNLVSSNYR
ncbi:hypothetical protein KGF54_000219 [Candida jiufengensis]|uniref:uncharacterized protein n=1 Tax=Candida jiufengensis TaxID=497108 RepID=UPI0022243566|nr:uncharacterized protein KGF54_000219 [Candida jiufengensis]KAI5957291.1 hypothetical protein KGF54_000219 [Candida jiufengensis]